MVITKDFESFDPGSSPGRTFVPVAQLDKASDYESEDWGFKSLQGYIFNEINIDSRGFYLVWVGVSAWMPERSKGADLRSAGRLSAWVRTPLQAYFFYC